MTRLLAAAWLGLASATAAAQPVTSDSTAVPDSTAAPDLVVDRPRLTAQLGHLGALYTAAFAPDGATVVTGGGDNDAVLWSVASGGELRRFSGHFYPIRGVAFTPDGRTLVTASADFDACVWDVDTAERRFCVQGHAEKINAVAVSPDGRTAATVGSGSLTLVWELATGAPLRRLPHPKPLHTVAFAPDGAALLTGGEDGVARLWDLAADTLRMEFTGHDTLTTVAFMPDGSAILTAGADGTARLRDAETGTELHRFTAGAPVRSAAFLGDGRRVLLGLADATARVWDPDTGAETLRLDGHADGVWATAAAPDGRTILTGGGNRDLEGRLWDADTGALLNVLAGRFGLVWDAGFSPDGAYLATAAWDNTARLWEAQGGLEVRLFQGHTGRLFDIAFSPDGTTVATASDDSTARLWGIETGEELQRYVGHRARVWDASFSPAGQTLLTASSDSTAALWSVATGMLLRRFTGHTHQVWDAAFSPTGDTVMTGSLDGTVRLWNTFSGAELLRIDTGGPVLDADFGPDGRTLLTGGLDRTAVLWSVETGAPLRTFTGHEDIVWAVAYAPDGGHVLTGSGDRTIRLWTIDTGAEARVFSGTAGRVTSFDVSPDGRHLLTADGTARLWDFADGRPLCRFISFLDFTWAVVDPEGRYDASNGGDVQGLHWVVGDEVVLLRQFKTQYYEPNLLAKHLGRNTDPLRAVEALPERNVGLFPNVEVTDLPDAADPRVRVRVQDQGGGIGRIAAFVNGKEITPDARADTTAGDSAEGSNAVELTIDPTATPYYKPGDRNEVEIVAYNAENYLSSRGVEAVVEDDGAVADPPRLWAIVAGVSDYTGAELDLRFASKDAADFAEALRLGAHRLYTPDRVHITLLNDSTGPATRSRLRAAFDSVAAHARSTDVIVIYLAGHGVNHGGVEGEYFYLTQDAASGDLADADARAETAVSASELTEWIKAVPAVQQVLILDTCAAARVFADLSTPRVVPSAQIRSIETVRDRTSTFVIAGSAADAVSYEASAYGQGVLTYSLLLGMRGPALRADAYVDVLDLFSFATERVPDLARGIGGIQEPELAIPFGGRSFDIGELTNEDRSQITLVAARPLILRSRFTPEAEPLDVLRLSARTNEALRRRTADGASPFFYLDADESPDAFRVLGRYRTAGDQVVADVFLYRGNEAAGRFTVEGSLIDLETLAGRIVEEVETRLPN